MRVEFPQVTRRRKVKVLCLRCQKKLVRMASVTHTVNPFNTDSYGVPKSAATVQIDVLEELSRLASKMERDGVLCKSCEGEP